MKEKALFPPVREIIKLNDEKSVIEVVHGRAEDIELPHQVDIIIRHGLTAIEPLLLIRIRIYVALVDPDQLAIKISV
jgi:hypothetical protein